MALRHAYADSVQWTLILALAAICITFPSSCATEWLNIRKIADQRQRLQKTEGSVEVVLKGANDDAVSDDVEKGTGGSPVIKQLDV